MDAEQHATLTINQEQQLNFGSLFARSSNISQAILLLSPLDSYTISEPHFILSELFTSPGGISTTDANGELLIKIGGNLKTELTASPVVHPSGQYEGTYQITVSY